jgi:hypothetical protein
VLAAAAAGCWSFEDDDAEQEQAGVEAMLAGSGGRVSPLSPRLQELQECVARALGAVLPQQPPIPGGKGIAAAAAGDEEEDQAVPVPDIFSIPGSPIMLELVMGSLEQQQQQPAPAAVSQQQHQQQLHAELTAASAGLQGLGLGHALRMPPLLQPGPGMQQEQQEHCQAWLDDVLRTAALGEDEQQLL